MKDLPRLLEYSNDELEIEALRSAEHDRGSEDALAKALGAMALVTALPAATLATTTSSASAAPSAALAKGAVSASISGVLPATSVVVAKGLFVGLLIGGATLSGVAAMDRAAAPMASVSATASVASAPRARQPKRAVMPKSSEDAPAPPVGSTLPRGAVTHVPIPARSGASPVSATRAAPQNEATFDDVAPSPRETELSRELALLDTARRDLAGGDARAALLALDRREREITNRALNPEATLVRVQALLANGERDRALALAKEFLSRVSSGPHAERMRRLVATSH